MNERSELKAAKKKNAGAWTKWFLGVAIFMVAYMGFVSGIAAQAHHYAVMGTNLVLMVFWAGIIVLQIKSFTIDTELKLLDQQIAELEKIQKMATELAEREARKNHDEEILRALMTDMGFRELPPPVQEFARIEAAFHENTDRYVKLSDEGNHIGAMFKSGPFPETENTSTWESKPGRSVRHAEAADRGNEARAAIVPTKPPTKSQQRRINAKKGLGPITDDEVREQRNAKRRATREAKKATTQTTTLAGQTDLGV